MGGRSSSSSICLSFSSISASSFLSSYVSPNIFPRGRPPTLGNIRELIAATKFSVFFLLSTFFGVEVVAAFAIFFIFLFMAPPTSLSSVFVYFASFASFTSVAALGVSLAVDDSLSDFSASSFLSSVGGGTVVVVLFSVTAFESSESASFLLSIRDGL